MTTVTANVYGNATRNIGLGKFDFSAAGSLKILLLSAGTGFSPDLENHSYRSDLIGEVAASGYTTGGLVLTGVSWTYNSTTKETVLTASQPTFSPMAATVRYAVVYGVQGTANTDPLFGVIDFDEDIDLTSEGLNIAWPTSGIFRVTL